MKRNQIDMMPSACNTKDDDKSNPLPNIYSEAHEWKEKVNKKSAFWALGVIVTLLAAGLWFGADSFIIGSTAVLVSLVTQAMSVIVLLLTSIPVIGPVAAHVLSIPFVWIVNGIGYVASLIAIKRGYSKDVITYRALTIATIVGIIIGYILGKYI